MSIVVLLGSEKRNKNLENFIHSMNNVRDISISTTLLENYDKKHYISFIDYSKMDLTSMKKIKEWLKTHSIMESGQEYPKENEYVLIEK